MDVWDPEDKPTVLSRIKAFQQCNWTLNLYKEEKNDDHNN